MYEELVGYVNLLNPYLNKLAAGYFVDDPHLPRHFSSTVRRRASIMDLWEVC